MGAMGGLVIGVVAGAGCGCLVELAGVNVLTNYFDFTAVILGAILFPAYFFVAGAIAGALAWAIVGAMQWRRDDTIHIIHQVIRGSLRASPITTMAGAASGTILFAAWNHYIEKATVSSALQSALVSFPGGFLYGSLLGCAIGILIGAIWGAKPEENWLNVPMRDLPNTVKAHWRHFIGGPSDD